MKMVILRFQAILLILIAAVLVLSGCGSKPPEAPPAQSAQPAQSTPLETVPPAQPEKPERYPFTRENFPILNGSTSTTPLGRAIAAELLGESPESVSDLIQFSKTTHSYRELMSGNADLLIAAEPAEVIWEEKAEQGYEWEMAPFAVDGLVFLVNEGNPVDSLTIEQIQKIYTGEITNWKQVGGADLEIVPFQRNTEAGSQIAMRKQVMKDLPLMEPPAEYLRGEMGDLVKAVASYDGTAAAIGYTVYYYAHDMKMADGLKLLAVDGVEPNAQTIRSGTYPFLNNYYVLTAAGLPDNSPAKALYDWILSEEGQRLVARTGYVSVLDVGEVTHAPAAGGEALYTYFAPYSGGGLLQARDDYGVLIPYVGTVVTLDQYITDRLPLYGLATAKGELVTDPVYADVQFLGPFLLLYRGAGDGGGVSGGDTWDGGRYYRTLAAADGSWVVDLKDEYFGSCGKNIIATADQHGSLSFRNAEGKVIARFPAERFYPYFGTGGFLWGDEGGPWINWTDDRMVYVEDYRHAGYSEEPIRLYLDLETGAVLETPLPGYPAEPDYGSLPVPPSLTLPKYSYLDPVSDPVTGIQYFYGYHREDGTYHLVDETGKLMSEDCSLIDLGIWSPMLRAGLLAETDGSVFRYRSLDDGSVILCWPIRGNSD